MKKLVVAFVAVCAGFCASAASFNWSAANDAFSPDGENPLEGTAYFFDAGSYAVATVSASLASTGKDVLANALGNKVLADGALTGFAGTGFDYDGTAPTSLAGYLVVLSTDEKNYWTSAEVVVTVTDAIKGGAEAVFNFGEVLDVSWTGAVGGGTAVPEPTSGLLLLVGGALLTLKRKRA